MGCKWFFSASLALLIVIDLVSPGGTASCLVAESGTVPYGADVGESISSILSLSVCFILDTHARCRCDQATIGVAAREVNIVGGWVTD